MVPDSYGSKGKILLDGTLSGPTIAVQQQYQNSVRVVLDQLKKTSVGAVLLDNVDRASFTVRIVPWLNAIPNASTGVDFTFFGGISVETNRALVASATPKGRDAVRGGVLSGGVCKPNTFFIKGKPVVGTGGGIGARIEITPAQWQVLTNQMFARRALIHELMHAHRRQIGKSLLTPTCNAMDDREEFFAVLTENLLVSELRTGGNLGLLYRANHRDPFEALAFNDANSEQFYEKNRGLITQFFREVPGVATAWMTLVDLEFNPLALRKFSKATLEGS